MHYIKKSFFLFIYIVLLTAGCLSIKQPGRRIDFYTLEYNSPKITGLTPLPCVIRIERFHVAPSYNSDKIIYSESKFKRDADTYHRWRANPGDLVTYFLLRDIKKSSLFTAVFAHDSMFLSSHVIEGTVDQFFEQDTEEGKCMAILSVSIILMAENEPDIIKRVLFQKRYKASEACRQKSPLALAEAMSRAMSRISEMMIKDIYDSLADKKGSL